jgi:hypothetical protein
MIKKNIHQKKNKIISNQPTKKNELAGRANRDKKNKK